MTIKDKGPAFWTIGGFLAALCVFLLVFIVTHSGLLPEDGPTAPPPQEDPVTQ